MERDLPVNPPGAYFREGFDVMMTEYDIYNWEGDGGPVFTPRLREALRDARTAEVSEYDPDLDEESLVDCD